MAQRHDGVRNLLTSLIGKRFAPTLKSNHDYNLSIMSDSTSEAREQARRQDWTHCLDALTATVTIVIYIKKIRSIESPADL